MKKGIFKEAFKFPDRWDYSMLLRGKQGKLFQSRKKRVTR